MRPAGPRRGVAAAVLFVGLTVGSLAQAAGADKTPGKPGVAADLALRNGALYTLDESRSWAEALAIRGNRIVYVGTNAGLRRFLGTHTRIVDLHGRMVLPGLQDAHIHPISGGIQARACDLYGQSTAEAYVEAVRRFAASHPQEAWITGGGWLLSAFGPGGQARKELLDAVVPDRPVYLASTDGHTVWVNSLALKLAHITAETPDPADGHIDRDPATREPLGTLQEGASAAVDAILPPVSPAARLAGLEYAVKMLNSFGITAIQDAAVYENDLKTYRTLEHQHGLSLRVVAALWWERGEGLEQIQRLERLRRDYRSALIDTGSVKIMLDGSLENYTAAVLEPYLTPEGGRGTTMIDAGALKTIVTRLDAAGFQVHFHTIGDRTVRVALDAIAAAQAADGQLDRRHHLAHLEMVDDADVARFRELGVVANFQPLWAYADPYITQLTIPFLGPERTRLLYRIGTLQRSGAVLAFGSDWSVSTANPFAQMQVAVTRMNPAGGDSAAFLPDERISLADALAAFTTGSAFVNRLEHRTGSLKAGKLADLAILDQNLFAVPPDQIGRTQVLATLFDGHIVHGSLEGL
jgi:predicted amidohydrolase YtcJ